MSRQLGLFGGSFNPIHNGHLHLAASVKEAMGLDAVMLMPAGEVPHKSCAAYASGKDRLAMCQLAAEAYPWMSVSDFELKKQGKCYTYDTLVALTAAMPDTRWTLLVGSDNLMIFDRWYRWQEILGMASLCAVSRTEGDLPMLQEKAASLQRAGVKGEITVLSVAPFPVSSTEIRQLLQEGADASCVLPKNVVQYIGTHHLYRSEEHGQGGAE